MRARHISVIAAVVVAAACPVAAAADTLGYATTASAPDFAGYWYTHHPYPAARLTTTFVVPRVKGCTKQDTGMVVVAEAATKYSNENGAALFVGCVGGTARYYPILALDGAEKAYPSLKARPGDKVVLTSASSKTASSVTLVDETHKGVRASLSDSGTAGGFGGFKVGDLYAFINGSRVPGPVPDFGTIHFSASKLNGKPYGDYAPERYNRAGSSLEIKTSRFSTNKENFDTVFVSSGGSKGGGR